MRTIIIILTFFTLITAASASNSYNLIELSKIMREGDMHKQLNAIEHILLNANTSDSLSLFLASKMAFLNEKKEVSAFLYFAGRIRSISDLKIYHSVGKGGNSPATLLGSLNYQISRMALPELLRKPVYYTNTIKRLEKWNPNYKNAYSPGWDYENTPNLAGARSLIYENKMKLIIQMKDISLLLNDKVYFESFLIMQDYNMNSFKYKKIPANKIEMEKAMKVMETIENKKNLNGFISSLKHKKVSNESNETGVSN